MSIVPKNNVIDFSPGELALLQPQKIAPLTFPLDHQILFPIESNYDKSLREKLPNEPTS